MAGGGFGELESVVMDTVWSAAEAVSVRQVREVIAAEREIAYTTVMTTMDNLHRKGWLDRERHGKAYLYWPTLTREQYSAGQMRAALHAGGRAEEVLARFIETMTPAQSQRLREALRQRPRGIDHPDPSD
ncbi:BlaI/MecI/CopY family transcriptional regulator [Nocardia farcinica]|uniref:BlaI/MecI/CopY family transcriptional regulator n=1 Tax=Nocardia TaxID=1817 RepID=UPI0018944B7B|nr:MULTISPECIES: BlaI/MecI/CopY family transcriptional regulator [Nocardia]MBF6289961.1 BlaI/MecI/CopY family transcriptional regulator [Nocardia cyriacigeorgica]MBF6422248.1 BlaI/MecI/CopY family transcriptional regulator [Nocardia farcinica]MBF6433904.1 BlaI/MecI/CopY family transcriptional regulator [Nocardia farcinica]MBF6504972.1 BlaI/MecI/CopY family transcriptional regulator [Nocardia farcinica]